MAVAIFHLRKSNVKDHGKQERPRSGPAELTLKTAIVCLRMKRRNFYRALTILVAVSAFSLGGCATAEYRISQHPEIYQGLSPQDQALVREGRIHEGMTQDAVWLAWGSPEQKGFGRMQGHQTETWIYRAYYNEYDPYFYGPGYGYGGFGTGIALVGRHHGRFVAVYDPFYDPFFYPRFRPVSYPYKTVTFQNGRVVAYQGLTPPRGGGY